MYIYIYEHTYIYLHHFRNLVLLRCGYWIYHNCLQRRHMRLLQIAKKLFAFRVELLQVNVKRSTMSQNTVSITGDDSSKNMLSIIEAIGGYAIYN